MNRIDRGPASGIFAADPEVPAEHVGATSARRQPFSRSRNRSNRCSPPGGTLRKIPNIGPSSTRIILEVCRPGRRPPSSARSPRAGTADEHGAAAAIARVIFSAARRLLAAAAQRAPEGSAAGGLPRDLQMHSTMERWEPDAGRHRRGRSPRGLHLLRRHRSFVRSKIRPRCVDGRPRRQHRDIDRLNRSIAARSG